VANEFADKDKRIKYFRQDENKGMGFNFKFVLEKARGEYFMWAADDDEWDSSFIEELVKIHKIKNVGLVACETEAFQPNREKIKKNYLVASKFNSEDKSLVFLNFMRVHHWTYHKADMVYGIFKINVLRENYYLSDRIHPSIGGDHVLLLAVISDSNIYFIDKKLRRRISPYFIDYKSTPAFNIRRIIGKYRHKENSNFDKILEFERVVDYIIEQNFNYHKKFILKAINKIYGFHLKSIL
jgi:glycosyltransferase involved in cell wall biosynthesis